jgi:hypothetical protein
VLRSGNGTGISINKDYPATIVSGLPQKSISALQELNKILNPNFTEYKEVNDPNAPVVVTGGTEEGHKSHGIGKNVFDLRKTADMVAYINQFPVAGKTSGGYDFYNITSGPLAGVQVLNESDHFHVNMDRNNNVY